MNLKGCLQICSRVPHNIYSVMKRFFAIVIVLCVSMVLAVGARAQDASPRKKAVIGISGYVDGTTSKLGMTYVESVRKAGGIPFVIPLTTDTSQISDIVSVIDGLIMSGGEDVSPFLFSEEPHVKLGEVVPDRDVFDLELIKQAIAAGKPVLAICRGEQVLNVALGGSLYQDIPSQVEGAVQHSQKAPRDYGSHSIKIVEGSLLYKLLGVNEIKVNSFHHQSVKDLGTGLKVTASAPDGVVEAIELEGGRGLGVQFHPEGFVFGGNMKFLPIFQWLVKEAKPCCK